VSKLLVYGMPWENPHQPFWGVLLELIGFCSSFAIPVIHGVEEVAPIENVTHHLGR